MDNADAEELSFPGYYSIYVWTPMSQWSKGWILAFDVRGLQLKSGCNIYLAEPDLGPWLQSDFCDQTLVKEFKF